MKIEKDYKEFIALLNKNRVKYLVVGGFAFSYYVEPRFTQDIDIFIEASKENSKKVMNTLDEFGFGDTGLKERDFQKSGRIIQLGYSPVRIDIITSITDVSFESAWKKKTKGKYGDTSCFFISKEDLIRNKQGIGRAQDIADVIKLKKTVQ
jgi:hypothetical protein